MKNSNTMELSADYAEWFSGRTVLITGVARSGTSILGKVLGSTDSTLFFYEPALVRLNAALVASQRLGDGAASYVCESMLGVFFEDIVLNHLHGRNVNFKTGDTSYIGHYESADAVEQRGEELERRSDALEYLEENDVTFVVKIPNVQASLDVLHDAIPGLRSVRIVRNGSDVVQSSVRRGWFRDAHLTDQNVEWGVPAPGGDGLLVPWYIEAEDRAHFADYDPFTRAACHWRVLVSEEPSGPGADIRRVSYESLVERPGETARELLDALSLRSTTRTEQHVEGIRDFEVSSYEHVSGRLEEPEKSRFAETMRRSGYGGEEV